MPLLLTLFLVGVLITASAVGLFLLLIGRRPLPTFFRSLISNEGEEKIVQNERQYDEYERRAKVPRVGVFIFAALTSAVGIAAFAVFVLSVMPLPLALASTVVLACLVAIAETKLYFKVLIIREYVIYTPYRLDTRDRITLHNRWLQERGDKIAAVVVGIASLLLIGVLIYWLFLVAPWIPICAFALALLGFHFSLWE